MKLSRNEREEDEENSKLKEWRCRRLSAWMGWKHSRRDHRREGLSSLSFEGHFILMSGGR